MINANALLLLFGVIAVFSAGYLYKEYRDRMKALETRVKKLEEAGQKRINYSSLTEIEHAMSGLVVLREELNFKTSIVDNIIAHLSKAHTPKAKQ
jgi:hypothetical protein